MTKTLTKQWQEGKLPAGLYYIEGKGDYHIAIIRNIFNHVLSSPYREDDVFEPEFVPIASVPSYYEYRELISKTEQLQKKLEISTKALELYAELDIVGEEAREALKEMEEVK